MCLGEFGLRREVPSRYHAPMKSLCRAFLLSAVLSSSSIAQDGGHGLATEDRYADDIKAASEEGAAAMAKFEVPEGFEISLFAEEPMLANPVCFYIDHDGTFYVSETFRHHSGVTDIRSHMSWRDQDLANRTVEDRIAMLEDRLGDKYDEYSEHHDRVRLIRDTDGDGKADYAKVFADGFTKHEAGIGAGLLSYRGNVYYTCIPDLWLLNDMNGDDVADAFVELSTGYGVNIALLGHDLHGLRIGPDGKLYFSCGDRGFHVKTPDGVIEHHHTGAVLRCNLDGTDLEVVHTGLRNPQELVFDDFGNLWTGDNNSDSIDKARWVHVVEGGESGWRYAYQWIEKPVARGPWNVEKLWHPHHPGQPAYIVPPITNVTSGPSGLTYYPGLGLPEEYANHFFLVDFRGGPSFSGVYTFDVTPKGAFWEMGEVEKFFWGCLATDAEFAPDGSLYAIDWVEGWNKTGKGRIYRVTHPDAAKDERITRAKALLSGGWSTVSLGELSELLAFADQRVRQEAQFELVRRGQEGWDLLSEAAARNSNLLARLHGIWGLGMAGRKNAEMFQRLLPLAMDGESEVRAQAIQVLGAEGVLEAKGAALGLLNDSEPRVRFFAGIAAGQLKVPEAVESLVKLLEDAGEEDPNLRHAAVMGLVGCATIRELRALATHPSVDVRVGAVVALRRLKDPSIAEFLKDSERRVVDEAARAIHDVPIDVAMTVLAGHVMELEGDEGPQFTRRVLNAAFLSGRGWYRPVAELVYLDKLPAERRAEALQALAQWEDPPVIDRVHGRYVHWDFDPKVREMPALGEIVDEMRRRGVAEGDALVATSWVRLVAKKRFVEHTPYLEELLRNEKLSVSVRVASLETLEEFGVDNLSSLVQGALRQGAGELRVAALKTLGRLEPEAALPLIPEIIRMGEREERRAAYRLLGDFESSEVDAILLAEFDKLATDHVPAELVLDLVLAAEKRKGSAELTERLAARKERRATDLKLAPYLDGLFGGRVDRGRDIFRGDQTLQCLRCHSVDKDEAGKVGPHLKGVSNRLSRLQMLESIVDPNRRTTPGFEATAIFREVGGVVAGRVIEDGDVVRVLKSDGEIEEIAKDEITASMPDLSAMPDNLAESLSREQMRDLLAYLSTL